VTGGLVLLFVALLLCEVACSTPASAPNGSSPVRGPPVDLAPHARLRASPPRAPEGALQARDDADGIATVRDDFPDTGYKPQPGVASEIEIDLGPLCGGPAPLESVALTFDGVTPTDVTVALADACGAAPTQALPWPKPGDMLALSGAKATCVTIRMTNPSDLVVRSISLIGAPPADVVFEPVLTHAATPRPGWGVIEGFYGRPWSWRERSHMLDLLANMGLSLYLYAPKDDPLHRKDWRKPYPDGAMAQFAALANKATALDLTLVVGLSPFLDYAFGSAADEAALRAKIAAFQAIGVHGFAILGDDIEAESNVTVDGALGAKHAEVVGKLQSELGSADPKFVLQFVPTVYSDARLNSWPGGEAYLKAIAALPASVGVWWTGTETASPALAAKDLVEVTSLIGRKPMIWDNYWANDMLDQVAGRVALGPLLGHAPDLPGAVSGYAQNPLIQGAVSRLVIGGFARWSKSGTAGDNDRFLSALTDASAWDSDSHDALGGAMLLSDVMHAFDGNFHAGPRWPELASAVQDLLATIQMPPKQQVGPASHLLTLCASAVRWSSLMQQSVFAADLVDELTEPLAKVRAEGIACLAALEAIGDKESGRDGANALTAAGAALAESASSRYLWGSGEISGLVDAAKTLASKNVLFVAPQSATLPLPPCRVGQAWTWTPFEAEPDWRLHGSPGRYEEVFVATGAAGWASRIETIVCLP